VGCTCGKTEGKGRGKYSGWKKRKEKDELIDKPQQRGA